MISEKDFGIIIFKTLKYIGFQIKKLTRFVPDLRIFENL